jgi:hypothetical protein
MFAAVPEDILTRAARPQPLCRATGGTILLQLVVLEYKAMINAVLVFNNAGQPRLTKFYTQLVRTTPPSQTAKQLTRRIGNLCPTTPHL